MIVSIFTVVRKGTQSFDPARKYMFNLGRLGGASEVSDYVTQLLFQGTALASPPQGIQVQGGFETIQNSIEGSVNMDNTFTITPNYINNVANSNPVSIKSGNILYGIESGANVLLFVANTLNVLTPTMYQINSTTLEAQTLFLNNLSDNINFTATFTTETLSSQSATYSVNQAVSLQLQKSTGEAWVPISAASATAAGTGTKVFNFDIGDLVLNDLMRIVAIRGDGTTVPILNGLFAGTGGSASGSGTPGDCTMYAYFDGGGWDDTLKTLNVGATCSQGYNIQIASKASFEESSIVEDINTDSTIVQLLDLPAGTYYARVGNLGGQTAFSSVLTFVNS